MVDQVRLMGLRFQACHGVLAHEKSVPQPFEVDVEMATDLSVAGASDRVEDTVNYAAVAATVQQVVEGPAVALLERLATLIAERVLAMKGVGAVRVRVRKMSPPIGVGARYAEVEVMRGG